MAEHVKTGRRAKAEATRARIVDAAHERFLADGYAATTLESIAAQASVAVQTVYFHHGSKRALLKAILDRLAVGDDEPQPLLERPWVREMRRAPDGRAVLEVWMATSRDIYERIAPLMRIVRDAASSDPEMAEQWAANQQQTLSAHRFLAEELDGRGALREGLEVEAAADELFALVSLELYVLLTADRGWSPERWERWATHVTAAAVLRPPADPG